MMSHSQFSSFHQMHFRCIHYSFVISFGALHFKEDSKRAPCRIAVTKTYDLLCLFALIIRLFSSYQTRQFPILESIRHLMKRPHSSSLIISFAFIFQILQSNYKFRLKLALKSKQNYLRKYCAILRNDFNSHPKCDSIQ